MQPIFQSLLHVPVLLLTFTVLTALPANIAAVTNGEWQQGQNLINAQNWAGAIKYGESLSQKYPSHHYGQYLIYVAAERLAGGDTAFWEVSAKAALKAASLEPARAPAHRAHAVWCFWNLKDYAAIAAQALHLNAGAVQQIGEHNYLLQINYITIAYVELGQQNTGARFYLRLATPYADKPVIANTANAMSALVGKSAKNLPEPEKWFSLLVTINQVGETNGYFLSPLAMLALELGDEFYRRKDYARALQYFTTALDANRATLAARDSFLHDELRIRQIAAAWRKENPQAKGRSERTAILLIVPETRLNLPANAAEAERFKAGDTSAASFVANKKIVSIAIPENQKNFQYFSDSVLALTGGEVEWKLKTIPLGGSRITRVEFHTDPRYNRWIAQAKPQFIEPALSPSVLKQVLAADATILMWPGTAKHPEVFVTNGGVTEHPWVSGDDSTHRALWVSEGDKLMHEGGSALFYHHEFFHLVEWGYYDRPFPKGDHQAQNRSSWPRDYSGATEFDFYEQSYLKHVLPVDNLARMEWKSGKTWLYKKKLDKR
jgi:hypothetical protein